MPHESLHQFSPLIFAFTASSSFPGIWFALALLPFAHRAERRKGKRSCCFGSPLGASCPDSAPSRDISETSCWSGPGREELGVWDIFQWRTSLSGLMLTCMRSLGPGRERERAIQESNRKYSPMNLRQDGSNVTSITNGGAQYF